MRENKNVLEDKIHLIDIENLMYTLFIIASLFNILTNEDVKERYVNGEKPNEEIRNRYLVASYIILIVFIVFLIRNYNNLLKLSKGSSQYDLAQIRLIGSVLLIIGQCIAIYYLYQTDTYNGSPI